MSKSWYKRSEDIELCNGTKVKEYHLVFETTDPVLAKRIEKFFQGLMDSKESDTVEE